MGWGYGRSYLLYGYPCVRYNEEAFEELEEELYSNEVDLKVGFIECNKGSYIENCVIGIEVKADALKVTKDFTLECPYIKRYAEILLKLKEHKDFEIEDNLGLYPVFHLNETENPFTE